MTAIPRRAVPLLAGLAAALVFGFAATTAAAQERPPRPEARAWVLVDATDGDRLAGRGISSERAIASTTKLMTAYLALRELPLDKTLTAPDYQPSSPLESLAGLAPGERMSVRDLLYALLLESANDAAVTLAEGVSGSVPRFVREMNRAAAALGLTGTHYENPIGLDSAANYSTAEDLAALTLRLRRDPVFRRIVDTPDALLKTGSHTRHIANRNLLVSRVPWVNGVKTGHTIEAGDVLVGSGTRKRATLVSVVLGAPSESARDEATLDLLDYGFSLYHREAAVRRGERVAAPDLKYQGTTLPLVARRGVAVGVRRSERVDTAVRAPGEVEGPIERGQRLGNVTVSVDGREIGTVPAVAARAADEASLLEQARGRYAGAAILIAIGAAGVILIGLVVIRRARGRRRRSPEERMRSYEDRMQQRQRQTVPEREAEQP
jgi:serine-type D-Ala-D-Ala carboxypeptidase (penicillin-binding protein 5/6)